MANAQHSPNCRALPVLLRRLRERAGLTQRDLDRRINNPQSWVFNCESANRRVDLTEFVQWATVGGLDPVDALKEFLNRRK